MSHHRIKLLVVVLSFSSLLFGQINLEIEKNFKVIPPNENQPFMFTNAVGLFYYGNTSSVNTSRFQGLSFLTSKIMEDYAIEINGQVMNRSQAEAHLFSNKLERKYNSLNMVEEIAVSDSLPVFIIKITSLHRLPISFRPIIATANGTRNYVSSWSFSDNMLFLSPAEQSEQNRKAGWIGFFTYPLGNLSDDEMEQKKNQSSAKTNAFFLPGKIDFVLADGINLIMVIVADNKNQVIEVRNELLTKFKPSIVKKEMAIE